MATVSNSTRIVWLDWMKTLAMFLIIAGHCWAPGYKYIYVFNVPCFFILSGFLSKKEDDLKQFWAKNWWNLIVPMVLLFFANTIVQFVVHLVNGTFKASFLWKTPLLALIGMQGNNYAAGGLKGLWFVYTLLLCKILLQYSPSKYNKLFLVILNTVFLLCSMFLYSKGIVVYNAVVDVLLAMPFFTLGYLLRPFKDKISSLSSRWILLCFIAGIMGVCLCGVYNDLVMMYRCSFGSNMLLFLIGGLLGTTLLLAISLLFKSYLFDFVRVIGGGTLIILGFHNIIIQIVGQFIHIQGWLLYVEAILILLFFYPINVLIKRRLPLLYGKYRAIN